MRPIERGDVPTDKSGQPKQYQQYEQAKPDLVSRLGKYCSYCERRISTHLAVEHIQSKEYQPQLERSWENFLLACTSCNSIKGTKVYDDTTQSYYYWPHLDNTFRAFVYQSGGMISINPALNEAEQKKAKKTLELAGLDRHLFAKNKPTPKDDRWFERRETWKIAKEVHTDLQNGAITARTLINLAKAQGFCSIWMTIFQDVPDILNQLIQAFPGTCGQCFDSNGQPIPRRRG